MWRHWTTGYVTALDYRVCDGIELRVCDRIGLQGIWRTQGMWQHWTQGMWQHWTQGMWRYWTTGYVTALASGYVTTFDLIWLVNQTCCRSSVERLQLDESVWFWILKACTHFLRTSSVFATFKSIMSILYLLYTQTLHWSDCIELGTLCKVVQKISLSLWHKCSYHLLITFITLSLF